MIRYLNSFVITLILYFIIIGTFFYTYSNINNNIEKKVEKKRISLNHIKLIKKEELVSKKIEVIPNIKSSIEKIKKQEKSKPIDKIKVKDTIKKSVKKVVKKKLIKKNIKKIKKVVKKEEPKVIKKVVKKEEINNHQKIANNFPSEVNPLKYKNDFLEKNLFLIKKSIQDNIKYSKRARKMNIEGDVIVEFSILKNGGISEIKALSGHKLLKKSTIKAIRKASTFFPKVSERITIKLPIKYKII